MADASPRLRRTSFQYGSKSVTKKNKTQGRWLARPTARGWISLRIPSPRGRAAAGWAGQSPHMVSGGSGSTLSESELIRHGVAVAAGVGAGDAVAAGRLDQHRGGAAGDAERLDPGNVVAARLQIVVDGVGHAGFDVQLVESRVVRPERAVEVQRLHPRPFESLMQIREPIGPELDDIQERLKDGLVLVVAARRADGHE